MIRYFCLLLLILCGCNNPKKDNNVIRVAVLRGPSAIAFAQWIENAPKIKEKQLSVELVDSPELMQAKLIKGEIDLAALPLINAANLYNKGLPYSLLGCSVWGNLYIVSRKQTTDSPKKEKILHIFGAGTTPDILTRYYLQQQGLSYSLNYSFSTAREIIQGLLAKKVQTAVLAEPFLSLALHKDSTLFIEADLNKPEEASSRFAQTAIIYAPSLSPEKETLNRLIHTTCQFAIEQPEKAIRILEGQNIFAPGSLTPESIQRCKIQYLPSKEAKESILAFLRLIELYEPKAIGGQLPDKGFIPEK